MVKLKKVKIKDEDIELENKDYVLVEVLRELTNAINSLRIK